MLFRSPHMQSLLTKGLLLSCVGTISKWPRGAMDKVLSPTRVSVSQHFSAWHSSLETKRQGKEGQGCWLSRFSIRSALTSFLKMLPSSWPCCQVDKALVFGTKDCRFESCQVIFVEQSFSSVPQHAHAGSRTRITSMEACMMPLHYVRFWVLLLQSRPVQLPTKFLQWFGPVHNQRNRLCHGVSMRR